MKNNAEAKAKTTQGETPHPRTCNSPSFSLTSLTTLACSSSTSTTPTNSLRSCLLSVKNIPKVKYETAFDNLNMT